MCPSKLVKTPYDELTYAIIGCAMQLHKDIGPGCRENTYQKGLEEKLGQAGLFYEAQKCYEVCDPGTQRIIGLYILDLLVSNQVVVEIKALHGLDNRHTAQVIGYLAVSKAPVGLLINFGERTLQFHRLFRPTKVTEVEINRQWLFVPDWLREN